MARLYPDPLPAAVRRNAARAGEVTIYTALAAALDDDWLVFYERRVKGSRRPIDFVVAHPERGLTVIEVKGGQVHAWRGAFRQKLPRSSHRKRIDPFGQSKRALVALFAAIGIAPAALPVHIVAFFPLMSASAFTWGASPHLLYREQLEPVALRSALSAAMPVRAGVRPDAYAAVVRALQG